MKIFALIILVSLLSVKSAFSQQVESLHSIKVGIPSITYSYEHALGKQFTINTEVGSNWGLQSSNNTTEITFSPVLIVEPRLYYSVIRRFKDNRFNNNSASFFSMYSSIIFTGVHINRYTPTICVIPKWGFRRAMGNHFIFEMQIGGGLQFYKNSSQFAPALDIKFGYVF